MKWIDFVHCFRGLYLPIAESTLYRYFLYKAYMPDEKYLKWKYRKSFGRSLNLIDPETFNEKLQWLKLNDRNDKYTQLVDKYAVRDYVEKVIGEEHLIPLLGVWDRPEDICFDELPDRFVLKTNHDSGGVLICKDKEHFDKEKAVKFLRKRMRYNSYWPSREWPYKNVKKKVIAEKYLVDESDYELKDYKFFCFNGVCKAAFIATDRATDTRFDFFDPEFNHLPIKNGHPTADKAIRRPDTWNDMIQIAEKLSVGIPQVRIDLYDACGTIFFGECTFYHWGGFVPFEPEEWDGIFGSWISLH